MLTTRCSDLLIHEVLDRIYPAYEVEKGRPFTVIGEDLAARTEVARESSARPPLIDDGTAEGVGLDIMAARCISGGLPPAATEPKFRLPSPDWRLIEETMKAADLDLCAVLCSPGTYLKKIRGSEPAGLRVALSQEIHYGYLLAVPPPEFLGVMTRVLLGGRWADKMSFVRTGRTFWFRVTDLPDLPDLQSRCDPKKFMDAIEVLE